MADSKPSVVLSYERQVRFIGTVSLSMQTFLGPHHLLIDDQCPGTRKEEDKHIPGRTDRVSFETQVRTNFQGEVEIRGCLFFDFA